MAHAALSARARDARSSIAELGAGAAWLVGTAAMVKVVDGVFGSQPLAAAVFGAVVADLAARRAGVDWDDPSGLRLAATKAPAVAGQRERAPRKSDPARDWEAAEVDAGNRSAHRELPWGVRLRWAGMGAALALGVNAIIVAVAAGTGWAHVHAGEPSVAALTALIPAAAHAVRDELLLRGVVLSACARAGLPRVVAIGFAGLAGGATIVMTDGASAAAVALATTSGWLFAVAFRRGAAWAAVSAHALWALAVTALSRGWLIDVHWVRGRLAMGAGADGAAAWLAAGACLVAAVIVHRWWPEAPARAGGGAAPKS